MSWRDEIRRAFDHRRRRVDDDVVEEMAQHADAEWQKRRAEGDATAAADAHVRALIDAWARGTAGPSRARREPLLASAPASTSRLAGLGLDVRHAVRLLRRQPAFAAVSILLIALGVGASTTIFSVVNGVLLTPLPWREPSRLVRVYETREGSTRNLPLCTNAAYTSWAASPQTIESIGAWETREWSVTGPAGTERVPGVAVTSSLFPLLGASPLVGSGFTAADEASGNTALISYGYWQDRFGGAPDVVGRSLTLGKASYTIAGVMPAAFAFPSADTRIWVPLHIGPVAAPGGGQSVDLFDAVARLKPGVTPAQAAAEATARGRAGTQLGLVGQAIFGSNGAVVVTVTPMLDAMTGDLKAALWVLLAAVALLLVAALGNVANMQLAHAAAERREVAIRAAIGAGAARIARMQFVQSASLSIAGSAVGLLLAAGTLKLLPRLLPADFPRAAGVALDGWVLAVSIALALLSTLAVGMLPARFAKRVRLTDAMSDGGTAPVGQGLRSPLARSRALIIIGQVAIASVLLVGAMLLSRSFLALVTTDRGFRPDNVLSARLSTEDLALPPAVNAELFETIRVRLSALPGVTAVGQSDVLPLTHSDRLTGFTMPDPHGGPPITVNALQRQVTPGYFTALGLRVTLGRAFNETDTKTSQPVAIVNQTFARQFLGASPVGADLTIALDSSRPGEQKWRVIGVVADVLPRSATDPPQPELYADVDQFVSGPSTVEYITVFTTGDPMALAPNVRAIVNAADARVIVDEVTSMRARLLTSLARPRLYAILFTSFGVFALLIAGIGLFGGLSYGVTQRTREIGVRVALGASPADIVWLIVSQGAVMTIVGAAGGLLVSAYASRLLSQFLFGISKGDAVSYAGVALLLLLITGVACALPARRAARIDPVRGLKS